MMKKFYLSALLVAGAAGTMNAADPVTIDFAPVNMQYMCLPGALPQTDIIILNISESNFYPDHSPKDPGWTLQLECVGPLSNTEVNEDPGVPTGHYTVGIGWDENNNYVPYTIRDWSMAMQKVQDPDGDYTSNYEIHSGELDFVKEGDKYYISGHFEALGQNAQDSQALTVNVPKVEVDPQYTFLGYPEVEDGYELENASLQGSYKVNTYHNTINWGEYNLQFYTTPLDANNTTCGAGAIMTIALCADAGDEIDPESLEGEYVVTDYRNSFFEPFQIRGGFLMPIGLVFAQSWTTYITEFDHNGYPIRSSYGDAGLSKVTYLGDLNYRIETELIGRFGASYRCTWEGPLLDAVKNAPKVVGIETVSADVNTAPREHFDLSGKRVEGTLAPGIYVVRQGDTVTKEVVK